MNTERIAEYPCAVCKQPIQINWCQSGIRIDGETLPAHVGCADQWGATEVEVFKITSPGNGSYFEEFPENVLEALKEMDEGSEYVIQKQTMTRAKYESLEEFHGF